MNFLSLSKQIREGELNNLELVKSLDKEIISKLAHISKFRDPNVNKLFGIDTIGHYSIAALLVINTPESPKKYEELMSDLDNWD